jgi:hypothetical protein
MVLHDLEIGKVHEPVAAEIAVSKRHTRLVPVILKDLEVREVDGEVPAGIARH